ncbi:PH domain-containing protein [Lachnoclostridium phytofermentans]|uniref:Bacterial Pleckstrin homology domain-containing protein n=1 Tax=Lachnoclostridium phytofermentans (strain ATCC 700394 / DSM 18823 / ISDg) TaxID=357809 RepID=A9KII2_LACP7|nr:PH domain-containing protein [Lachnoclostridium phytofermentans]ABX42434.1 hypothetical protein Cphy_2066 [Lachnoclostridium phytofermentans ISDg]
MNKNKIGLIRVIIAIVILAFVLIAFVIIGKKGIKAELLEDSIVVTAFLFDEKVSYDNVESVELCDNIDYGRRSFGVGTFQIKSGNFHNDRFGDYKLAITEASTNCIVIKILGGSYLVFNQKSNQDTNDFYTKLIQKVPVIK